MERGGRGAQPPPHHGNLQRGDSEFPSSGGEIVWLLKITSLVGSMGGEGGGQCSARGTGLDGVVGVDGEDVHRQQLDVGVEGRQPPHLRVGDDAPLVHRPGVSQGHRSTGGPKERNAFRNVCPVSVTQLLGKFLLYATHSLCLPPREDPMRGP